MACRCFLVLKVGYISLNVFIVIVTMVTTAVYVGIVVVININRFYANYFICSGRHVLAALWKLSIICIWKLLYFNFFTTDVYSTVVQFVIAGRRAKVFIVQTIFTQYYLYACRVFMNNSTYM